MLDSFSHINVFVFDMDGVLTDGTLVIMENLMARKMHVKDGYALQQAVNKGFAVFVISGGDSPQVKERLLKLGVSGVLMKVQNKLEKLQSIISDNQFNREQVLFMGDDIPDYEAMQYCGLACCPADAVAEIKNISKYISPVKGGEGCVRDVIEKVMKLQGKWVLDMQTPVV
ncbi:MAG: HAD hydrolase family protein [Bacteroidetes bacterium]|nr:HAD hydrolase family protein [Bacteroidota bacterium]